MLKNLLPLAILAAAVGTASGSTLVLYDFDGGSGELANLSPTTTAAGVDATDVSLVSLSENNDEAGKLDFEGAGSDFTSSYLAFTLTGTGLNQIDLNGGSLSADLDYVNGRRDQQGMQVELIVGGTSVRLAAIDDLEGLSYASEPISGLPIAAPGDPVEVRLYFTNTSWGDQNIDNLSLDGTVAPIPEPGTVALLALAGVLLVPAVRFFRR